MVKLQTEQSNFETPSVLVIYKKSKYDLYFNDRQNEHYQKLSKEGHVSIETLKSAHDEHQRTVESVKDVLKLGGVDFIVRYRAHVNVADVQDRWVVTVGGDGTLLDAASRLENNPIFGVNSDTKHSVGFFCAADRENFAEVFARALRREFRPTPMIRMQAELDGERLKPILNDVLIANNNPAATARFVVEHQGESLTFKSSGAWVSTPAGSTAAMRSAGGRVQTLDEKELQFKVREAYWPSRKIEEKEHFFVAENDSVRVESRMRKGSIFLDGPHRRYAFPTGSSLLLKASDTPLNLFSTDEMRERRRKLMRP